MQVKEEKICSFTQNGTRLQLVKITTLEANETYIEGFKKGIIKPYDTDYTIKYQIRQNRKVIQTTLLEYQSRKQFAQMVTNIVLQLKIY